MNKEVKHLQKRILVIEDEVKLARFVELELKHEGYDVSVAHDGKTGFERFTDGGYDLVLLDLMLPGINGLEICRKIRMTDVEIPIIMLTARGEVIDKVVGLDSGADDYVTKPFAIEEILARMRVAFKRKETTASDKKNIVKVQDVTIDTQQRKVQYKDTEIELTKTEYDLLHYLAENKNIVLTREQILNRVWGYEYVGETNVVDVYIRYLRTKLDSRFDFKLIHTTRGVGYCVKDEA